MNASRFDDLVGELCAAVGLPDEQAVIERGAIEVDGFHVLLARLDEDGDAIYLNFDYGVPSAGRSLRVYQLLLEANMAIYAQDQAQMGLNPDTGGVLLIVRVPLTPEVDGHWLADLLSHYVEHGRYWRDSILGAHDEMFDGLAAGRYLWLRA